MDVLRDLLDKQIIDARHRDAGRVDTVVFELREGAPPRLIAVEVGVTALARRFHPGWSVRLRRALARWGVDLARPVRIPVEHLDWENGVNVRWDDPADPSPVLEWELWWRRHVVAKLPGGGA
jgi:hypothetical protein